MSLSAAEFYEAGMNLPPSARKDVALRLLESLEVADQESVDEAWTAEIGSRVDDVLAARSRQSPAKRSLLESMRALPNAKLPGTHEPRLRVSPGGGR